MERLASVWAGVILAWSLVGTTALAAGRWQQVENAENCEVWNGDPQPNEKVTWTGSGVNGKAEGRGKLVWRFMKYKKLKEQSYTGSMRGGKINGPGLLEFANGDRYTGDIKNAMVHGKGVYVFANLDSYEGEFKDGMQEGHGVFVAADGDKCEGVWHRGKMLGKGKAKMHGKLLKCHIYYH